MDCYPPCRSCTGLCKEPAAKRAGRVAPIRRKRGYTNLRCGHMVEASEITLTVLGDRLGAQPWCDRCGDFQPIKKTRKKKVTYPGDPLF